MSHEPKHYDLPNHLVRIFASPEYADAAKKAGKTVEAFQNEVAAELKKIVKEERDAELKKHEDALAARVFAALNKK